MLFLIEVHVKTYSDTCDANYQCNVTAGLICNVTCYCFGSPKWYEVLKLNYSHLSF